MKVDISKKETLFLSRDDIAQKIEADKLQPPKIANLGYIAGSTRNYENIDTELQNTERNKHTFSDVF